MATIQLVATTSHIWWTKFEYRTPEEKRFRSFGAFVIGCVPLEVHKQLHHDVGPPPKPYRWEMQPCMEFAQESQRNHDNPLWGVESAIQFYVVRGIEFPETEPHCREIRWNLAKQIGVLAQAFPLGDLSGK